MKTNMITKMIAASALGLLALSLVNPARSQEAAQPLQITASAEGITASGHGEVKAKPDIALVTLTVTTQDADQAQAVGINAAQTTLVLRALQGAGVAAKDIETQSYTVQPQYDYKPSPPLLTGYQVQNSLQVTVRDLTKVGLVIDKTTAKGPAAEVGGVSFDLSDRTQSQSRALSLAVASAKLKAGVMADAAGVSLGRLLTLTEGSSAPVIRPVYAMRALAASALAPETPINDQQITITADATLVYAMGPTK